MIPFENESASVGTSGSERQIAILLQTLPARTHRVLLGQLGTGDVDRIRASQRTLGEVDAIEQYRVLKRLHDELQNETQSVEKVESEIQDEIQIGRARVSKKRGPSIYRPNDSTSDRNGDSSSASGQAITDSSQNGSRMGGNSEADASNHLFEFQSQTDVVAGQPAVPPTTEMLQSMIAQFHQTQAAGVLPLATAAHSHGAGTDHAHRSGALPPSGAASSLDRARHGESAPHQTDPEQEAEDFARRVDQFLIQLPSEDLCRALGMVTTKQAFLVLCGLPNETAELVLEMLPRKQARKVRNDMRRIGKLQLSDIDAAKRVVAQIAVGLSSRAASLAA